ncbi:MAG: dTDP-4-dehydrorhamnose 3,5-epimerase [Bacteroidia bacterium]|jgi:dTDP-4-dehydrorhamnose 3,5-epimerase
MTIEHTHIKDLIIIHPTVFEDERGYFYESYNAKQYQEHGLPTNFVQDNQSKSNKGVLRGLHFQNPPYAQGKLVRVIKGAVLDVAVDIRKSSATYGQHIAIELNETNKTMLYVPEGFAHGFVTLQNDTIFSYKCTNFYNNKEEVSLLWNDATLSINWNENNPSLSAKDIAGISFNQFNSPFS